MEPPPVQYVTTPDGFSIAYTVCGEGRPLVFLPHPSCHTHLYWRSRNIFSLLYQHLASRFRLICYDGRGQGSSTRGLPDSYRIDDQLIDLATVVERTGLQDLTFLSQHGSARPALKYAADHPDRVRALVLWNAHTGRPELDGWEVAQMEALPASNWDLYIDVMARSGWFKEDPELAKYFLRESMTQADTLLFLRAHRQYELSDVLGRVRSPTLLLASSGRLNPYANENASRYIASQIEGARVEVFDDHGAGLFTLDTAPPPAISIIEEFVEGAVRGSAPLASTTSSINGLSPREVEVLRLLGAGRSNQQIADELVISLNTVLRHVSNIFDKTGAANRAEAATYAAHKGLT
jgi:DNA-binding CsgD family transcriptional regulator